MASDATSGAPPAGEDVPELASGDSVEDADVDEAALAAFARARKAARDRGLRPGSPAARSRVPRGTGRAAEGDGSRREPERLGEQLDRLLLDRGWNVDVAVGSVMGRWPAIVGPTVAEHSKPVTFEDGVLTVRADSTAWATQLRLLSSSLMGRLEAEVGADVVLELRIQGPSAPSWSRGRRRAPGPGPRDTYG